MKYLKTVISPTAPSVKEATVWIKPLGNNGVALYVLTNGKWQEMQVVGDTANAITLGGYTFSEDALAALWANYTGTVTVGDHTISAYIYQLHLTHTIDPNYQGLIYRYSDLPTNYGADDAGKYFIAAEAIFATGITIYKGKTVKWNGSAWETTIQKIVTDSVKVVDDGVAIKYGDLEYKMYDASGAAPGRESDDDAIGKSIYD